MSANEGDWDSAVTAVVVAWPDMAVETLVGVLVVLVITGIGAIAQYVFIDTDNSLHVHMSIHN